MKYIITIILLGPLLAVGQTKEEPVFGLKFYASPSLSISRFQYDISPFSFTPSFTISKHENRFFEFGFSQLNFTSRFFDNSNQLIRLYPEGQYNIRSGNIGIYAEQNYLLAKSKNEKWAFYLGPRVGLNFWRSNFNALNGDTGPNYNDLSLGIGMAPRICYNLTDRIGIDFSVPITYETSYRFGNDYDPNGFAYNTLPRFDGIYSRFAANARFGLTIKLGK
ncbi:MAG: hypothetical protein JXQ87_06090 [Bacteroidia bacterium]